MLHLWWLCSHGETVCLQLIMCACQSANVFWWRWWGSTALLLVIIFESNSCKIPVLYIYFKAAESILYLNGMNVCCQQGDKIWSLNSTAGERDKMKPEKVCQSEWVTKTKQKRRVIGVFGLAAFPDKSIVLSLVNVRKRLTSFLTSLAASLHARHVWIYRLKPNNPIQTIYRNYYVWGEGTYHPEQLCGLLTCFQ